MPVTMTRRRVLQGGASAAVLGAAGCDSAPSAAPDPGDVYRRLGIEPVINGIGTVTVLGGSRRAFRHGPRPSPKPRPVTSTSPPHTPTTERLRTVKRPLRRPPGPPRIRARRTSAVSTCGAPPSRPLGAAASERSGRRSGSPSLRWRGAMQPRARPGRVLDRPQSPLLQGWSSGFGLYSPSGRYRSRPPGRSDDSLPHPPHKIRTRCNRRAAGARSHLRPPRPRGSR